MHVWRIQCSQSYCSRQAGSRQQGAQESAQRPHLAQALPHKVLEVGGELGALQLQVGQMAGAQAHTMGC